MNIAMTAPRLVGALIVASGAFAPLASAVAADKYPSRPIEIIVPFGPGGGADLVARTLARMAEPKLGVPMPVSNVSGASGTAGLTKMLNNPADGYTMGALISLTISAWASGIGKLKPQDFTVVAYMQSSPSMLFVPKNSPFKKIQDLLDHAKKNPGKLRTATTGYGTDDDVVLKYMGTLGYKITNVPFAKPAERYASTVGAHTDILFEQPGDVAQFVKSGDLVPLIVFDDERHEAFKNVPASKELGMKISDLPTWRTLVVSSKTPADKVKKLEQTFTQILQTPEWKKYCEETYTCIKPKNSAEGTKATADYYVSIKDYLAKFGAAPKK